MKRFLSKKWLSFAVMLMAAGTIYKLAFLNGPFYIQMQEFMHLTHTQLGNVISLGGIVSTFAFLGAMFLTDRFSKRRMMSFAMIVNGLAGFALALLPSYPIVMLLTGVFALCSDMLFWPTMLKAVRLLGNDSEQGRMFGFLETGRGLMDTIVNFTALAIFAALGSTAFGFSMAIVFYSVLNIVFGILVFIMVEDDEIVKLESAAEKNKFALSSIKNVVKNKYVWLVAFNIFMVYAAYSGIKYFVPFMNSVLGLSSVLASAYAIINSYGLKMVGGPIGGYLSDKVFHSPAKFISTMFAITAASLVLYTVLPLERFPIVAVVIISLLISGFLFCMRAVYFAPMSEVNVPQEFTGAAMSLGSFIGYLPGAFMNTVFGNILDRNPGYVGYKIVFWIMAALCAVGIFVSLALVKSIKRIKEQQAAWV